MLIGLTLDPAGWADVDELLEKADRAGFPITREVLQAVVEHNDKQRFAFSEDRHRIRANQGHTVPVDLELTSIPPPDVLYHGTSRGSAEMIRREGLTARGRHHVHLSSDSATATAVGRRHGRPVVFTVDAKKMADDGHTFYRSANGVWLTETVPPGYLEQAGADDG
jgi:putative RNA 2'-phosphotransferase